MLVKKRNPHHLTSNNHLKSSGARKIVVPGAVLLLTQIKDKPWLRECSSRVSCCWLTVSAHECVCEGETRGSSVIVIRTLQRMCQQDALHVVSRCAWSSRSQCATMASSLAKGDERKTMMCGTVFESDFSVVGGRSIGRRE